MGPLPPQALPSGLASLSAQACGACHLQTHDQWSESVHAQAWTDPIYRAALKAAFGAADAVFATVSDRIDAEVLAGPVRARFLGNFGVGVDHIDLQAAKARGILVTNTPGVLTDATADLTMTLLLMAARRAAEGERHVRAGAWTGWRPTHLMGTKVSGKTLGLVGFGRIGQAVAKRAHYGFDMKILVHSRSRIDPAVLARYNATQVDTLEELLPRADFVSLHCPGGASTRHMIGASHLNLMKPDAYLINTARGEVVEELALSQALMFGTIGGAGLDVFDGEPRINATLMQCDNLVMLPHLGSATREAREAMGFRVLDNLADFFAGREPRDRVV